jgi:hypothetical protein
VLLSGWPYFTWAFGVATMFFGVTTFAISLLHDDKKANLSLWLQGDYQSTWPAQFGTMFDSIFGQNHFRLRCVLLSAIASIIAVFALWLLFDVILGLISLRAVTGLSLTQALLLGAAINIIPDFISLYETRWLLKQFERISNPILQLFVLAVDALITGAIIYAGVALYLLITDNPQVSAVEMIALFSFYAIFFYSTFLTSIWAWAYCLSYWVAKLSSRLGGWLDLRGSPGKIFAFIGAIIIFAGSFAAKPLITMDETGRISIDDFLCSTFPASACTHVARLTADDLQKIEYLSKACLGGVTGECLSSVWFQVLSNPRQAEALFEKLCRNGNAKGCSSLGFAHEMTISHHFDYDRVNNSYRKGCDGGDYFGCNRLAYGFQYGHGVEVNFALAAQLYLQGCKLGGASGCTSLGDLYFHALGFVQNYETAHGFYQQGCDGGDALGCTNLGYMYGHALGVEQDYTRARELFQQVCDGGNVAGCAELGNYYRLGLGGETDMSKAQTLLKRACEGGNQWGCDKLAKMAE